MGRKKATQLKPETKQLLDAHIDAATVAPTPSSQLFFVDKSASSTTSKKNAVVGKRKREEEETNGKGGNKKKKTAAKADAVDDDAMDTSDGAAEGAYFHDSDDEVLDHVTRNRHQRSAHKQGATVLVNDREVKRLKTAVSIKSTKEAAAAAANPKLFDLWATTLEEDLKRGIVPASNEKGFRTGRVAQTRFRHVGGERAKDLTTASVLPKQIEGGTSFHPDRDTHQALLRKAYEKDEAEREEIRLIRARFTVRQEDAETPAVAPVDDAWMDDGTEPIKGPTPGTKKYSKTQRNKMARAAENRAKVEAQQESKAFGKFVERIPVLMAEWKKKDKIRAKEKAKVDVLKKTQPDRKPKLGKFEETEQFPDYALTEELPEEGALRQVKPSTHVLEDQFARFQQRHLIETRKRVKPTRGAKAKTYERFKEYEAEQLAAAKEAETAATKAATTKK